MSLLFFSLCFVSLSPFQPPTGGVGRLHDVIRLRKTYQEYKSLLSSFARWQQGLEELNQRLKTFMQNYVVVERESLLRDTSAKLEKMAKQAAIVSLVEIGSKYTVVLILWKVDVGRWVTGHKQN